MTLRFGKNPIRLNGGPNQQQPNPHVARAQDPTGTPSISQTTKNAWQVVDLAQSKRDSNGMPNSATNATTAHQQIFLLNNQQKANPSYLNSVNVSTKLQQQVLMIPDSTKAGNASVSVKGRTSPRVFNEQ